MKKETDDRRLEQLFGEALGDMPSASETEAEWQKFKTRIPSRKPIALHWTISAIAAAIALAFLLIRPSTETEIQVFASLDAPQELRTEEVGTDRIVATPSATTTVVTLPDGTEVTLSANSRLEYPKAFGQRQVKLTGEAEFRVAKDSLRPFVVHTERMQTTVLGTRFNVKSYPSDRPSVTLFQGSVQVSLPHQEVKLKPGEELSLDEKGRSRLDACKETRKDWMRHEFLFDNLRLADVMREVGAWYNQNVVFRSRDLMDERIYFKMSRGLPCAELLEALNDLQIATFRWEEGRIVVEE
ncbi:MAG: FecR domain-containing protein [Bacteroides sp.]|nr:FecR domain-containing protein [Bacteroides sp.]